MRGKGTKLGELGKAFPPHPALLLGEWLYCHLKAEIPDFYVRDYAANPNSGFLRSGILRSGFLRSAVCVCVFFFVCRCVCVCVCVRERERESVCVCVCVPSRSFICPYWFKVTLIGK